MHISNFSNQITSLTTRYPRSQLRDSWSYNNLAIRSGRLPSLELWMEPWPVRIYVYVINLNWLFFTKFCLCCWEFPSLRFEALVVVMLQYSHLSLPSLVASSSLLCHLTIKLGCYSRIGSQVGIESCNTCIGWPQPIVFSIVPFVLILGWAGSITAGHTKSKPWILGRSLSILMSCFRLLETTTNAVIICAYAIGNAAGPLMWKKQYQPRYVLNSYLSLFIYS